MPEPRSLNVLIAFVAVVALLFGGVALALTINANAEVRELRELLKATDDAVQLHERRWSMLEDRERALLQEWAPIVRSTGAVHADWQPRKVEDLLAPLRAMVEPGKP